MEKNKIYWIIAILLVNILWGNIAGNTVSQEINRPGADFSYEREALKFKTDVVCDKARNRV